MDERISQVAGEELVWATNEKCKPKGDILRVSDKAPDTMSAQVFSLLTMEFKLCIGHHFKHKSGAE
jgi:hypothetical protein